MTELLPATVPPDFLFPVAFGHEHETSHQIGQAGMAMSESGVLASSIYQHIPSSLRAQASFKSLNFLLNGFKVYMGGTNMIEIATPECDSPSQLVQYRRAAELLAEDIFLNFARKQSKSVDDKEILLRVQNRLVDSRGSRKGSHMNTGLANTEEYPVDIAMMVDFFSCRSFVTGSGYVGSTDTYYSQKLGGLLQLDGYGHWGSMYREVHEDDTLRFEDRCGDLNISDWAVWQHAGSLGLALALSRTPLADQLPELPEYSSPILRAKRLNVMRIDEDGGLRDTPDSRAALSYLETLAELVMDKLILYVEDLPENYYQVARSLHQYCQDYRRVLNGEVDISALADRSDWALKMSIILSRLHKDRGHGIKRSPNDYESKAGDMRYDRQSYTLTEGRILSSVRGAGYKMRDRGTLSNLVTARAAEQAYRHAPTTTRAYLRTDLQRHYNVVDIDWHYVTLACPQTEHSFKVRLNDVRATEFSPEAIEAMANIKEK